MRLWRISNYADLTGVGGLKASARWHTKGKAIVYTAEHPAAALVEMLVHVDFADLPETFQLITVEVGAGVATETVERGSLSGGWIGDLRHTQSIGDAWLRRRSSVLLRVPSAIVPDCVNVLINPGHQDANRIKIAKFEHVPLDARLRP
jgi:RES domain-containing protein